MEEKAMARQYTADGRLLVNIQIDTGGGGGRSLSPELAEQYFNYIEVIFAKTGVAGDFTGGVEYYRAAGPTGQVIRLAVPLGIYDNTAGDYAIMLAGMRTSATGECTLLGTGVIVAHTGGAEGEPVAKIGPDTTRVTFKLTALSAEVKSAVDGAFQTELTSGQSPRYGTTSIEGDSYPWFGIRTQAQAADTTANLTISGWENTAAGNNTQRFMYVTEAGEEFSLTGIPTNDGDQPLPAKSVMGIITNSTGLMGDGDSIDITFTSMTTQSGMGWFPVRLGVKAFGDVDGGQMWYIGSGISQKHLSGDSRSVGAGIVLLHGNKVGGLAVGVGWVWDFLLLGYSGKYKITFTDGEVIHGNTAFSIYLEPRYLGKVVRSIESVGATPALTDGYGNTVIYIGRKVAKGGKMITLDFDAVSGELRHRAADGSGFIPIGSYAEFQLINSGSTNMSKNYKQEANLDLLGDQNGNGTFGENGDLDWTPVGLIQAFSFTGTFDGDGKDIANLYIDRPGTNAIGLFGSSSGAFKNVHIRSGSVTGQQGVGGVVGILTGGSIENCSNAGTVTGAMDAGGVAGENNGSMVDCSNAGQITGVSFTGGVAGENRGSMVACSNTGQVMVEKSSGGGVAGNNWGTITASSNAGQVTGGNNSGYMGGVAAWNYGTIAACSNTGQVWVDGFGGGVVSQNYGGTIIASFNTGSVKVSSTVSYDTGGDMVTGGGGGVAATNNNGTITACYNVGEILGGACGGVVAVNINNAYQIACYWLWLPGGDASTAVRINNSAPGNDNSLEFSSTNWPDGNSDAETAWKIGNADGSGSGHYWKSMGTPSDNPGPNDFPKLWWE
jgi:hypothetical protein